MPMNIMLATERSTMATPGILRLLQTIADGSVERFSPSITDDGGVNYPTVERELPPSDGDPVEALERLAEMGVLFREFQEKAYVCPECRADGMRYTTVCADCGSEHTIERQQREHPPCGVIAPDAEFQTENGGACPHCDQGVAIEDLPVVHQHVCQTCGSYADGTVGALRCRECAAVFDPQNAIEWVLYGYGIEEYGHQWLTTQLNARAALQSMLADRGFEVDIDTAVRMDDGDRDVHLYATEELLDDRVIGAVHDRPDETDVDRLHRIASAANARGVLATTSGSVTERADALAQEYDIKLLRYTQEGTLAPDYTTDCEQADRSRSSVFERLTASFR